MTTGVRGSGPVPGRRIRLALWAGAGVSMVVPVVAMRLPHGLAHDAADFVFLAALLVGMGGVGELAARVPDRWARRAAAGLALAALLLQGWMILAVGIIGSEDDPANLVHVGVFAAAGIGAALARGQPAGMARAMTATAIAQVAAFGVALATGLGFTGPITLFLAALWLWSAWLFRRAARRRR
ncbi:MAG TPA: hypothetical protein VF592_08240 [Sphingomonas sp.]|uniref:hypothetical protein n=1 Tax=Sphingomonas sp. TaxID=28214 RepID=UPI002ED9E09C